MLVLDVMRVAFGMVSMSITVLLAPAAHLEFSVTVVQLLVARRKWENCHPQRGVGACTSPE